MRDSADARSLIHSYADQRVEQATEPILQPLQGSGVTEAGRQAERVPRGPRAPGWAQTLLWMYRPTQLLERCRRRYGDIFRLRLGPGRNTIVVAEPTAARRVITGDPSTFRAGDANGILKPVVGPSSLLVLDEDEHLRHRRILLPAFGAEHGREFAERVASVTRRRVAAWKPGETMKLQAEMEAISLEAILGIALGNDSEERRERFRVLIPEMMERCASPFTLLPYFRHELGGITPYAGLRKLLAELDGVFFDAIVERQASSDDRASDALSLLCAATDESGTPLSNSQIRDELLTMIMAGYETTTSALAWSFERLLRSPEILQRLLEDLDRGGDEYLDAVVCEVLRMRPVVPVVVRKTREDLELNGHLVSSGSVLMVAIYLMHRDPDLYKDPNVFRPERFLQREADVPWLPFGGGVRRCLGASFAQLEMKVVIRTVLSMARLHADRSRAEPVKRRRFTFAPGRDARVTIDEVAAGR
jgi:cytochrome P450 family 135